MLKRLSLSLLLVSLSVLAQGSEFKLMGRTTWQLGELMVNGIPFVIDEQTRFKDGLNEDDLGGTWVELEGVVLGGRNLVREIEPLEEDEDLDLEGRVEGGRVWGYSAEDGSLTPFEGRWVALECHFDGMRLSRCRVDD